MAEEIDNPPESEWPEWLLEIKRRHEARDHEVYRQRTEERRAYVDAIEAKKRAEDAARRRDEAARHEEKLARMSISQYLEYAARCAGVHSLTYDAQKAAVEEWRAIRARYMKKP